jgi:hypothetical protein
MGSQPPIIDMEYIEYCPIVTPGGKYLSLTSNRSGNGDI